MQDWKPLVLTKSSASVANTKFVQPSEHVVKASKLDQATEPDVIDKMPRNIVMQLIAARIAKKLSQKQLATKLNIPSKTIQDIESHKHAKDMNLAQRIARDLGCKLKK